MTRGNRSYFASEETVTVNLDDGIWVELKKELDYGEESELEGAAIKAGLNPDGSAKMEFSLKQQRQLMLALYLVDWNLPGANGKVVALPESLARKQEVVGRLSSKAARQIVGWITRLRAEAGAVDQISLKEAEGAEADPTEPGAASATATPSASPSGSGAPFEMSSRLQTVS